MENLTESTQLIGDAKNIYLMPSKEPEAIALTLALFYTLKELGKNVNLIIETLPENLKFLSPSLDFISYPKNFVISIPEKVAKVSQVFYEKNDEGLKIHLTIENGNIKKDNIAFYFSETRPDLIITLGIKDYAEQLSQYLNSFGFLLDSPILNIDREQNNKKFGKINLLDNNSLSEAVVRLVTHLHGLPVKKELAECLLAGIIICTDNFKKNITADIFEMAGSLMKRGADLASITNHINKSANT